MRTNEYPNGGGAGQLVQRCAQALGVGPAERVIMKDGVDIMVAEIQLRIEYRGGKVDGNRKREKYNASCVRRFEKNQQK